MTAPRVATERPAPAASRSAARDTRRWAALALAAAVVITIALLALGRPPATEVLAVAALSIGLDALAIATLLRRRGPRGRTAVMFYAAIRALVAAVWFMMIATLPAYAAAALLLAWPSARRPRGGPAHGANEPHEFRAVGDSWYGTGTPLGWSRNVVGAAQQGAQHCVVCGRSADDLLHAPPEPAG